MPTEKQIRARKRNWLIMRLLGAKSIFSHDNIILMDESLKENSFLVWECHEAIDDLIAALRKNEKEIACSSRRPALSQQI